LPKMSAIENTIPNTIPASTVFIGKAPRDVRHISLGERVKNAPLVLCHRSQGRFATRIRRAQCSIRKLKLLVLMYRAAAGSRVPLLLP
jgi:hypothetical protein